MGWEGDQRLAEAIKAANPSIRIAFVGPPVTTDPDNALNECSALDFICRREFDYSVVEFAQGKPLNEILGISYKQDGKIVHNPDRPQVEDLDAMPWATKIYKRDMDVTRYNVPFLLHPLHRALLHARLPGAVHLLPVAANAERARLAQALHRRCGRRADVGQGELPRGEGILLRRRHLQHPEGAHHRAVRKAEAAGPHLELHIARDHRLRHAEGHEAKPAAGCSSSASSPAIRRFSRTSRRAQPWSARAPSPRTATTWA